jgi:hypothetical protein
MGCSERYRRHYQGVVGGGSLRGRIGPHLKRAHRHGTGGGDQLCQLGM